MPAFKVAAAQVSSTYFDKGACLATALRYIAEAADSDCKLIVFAELFMPGYPFYIWIKSYGETLPFVPEYYANAVENNGPEAEALKAAARKYKIRVIIGVAEKDHGSLYMTQWIISPDGGLVARRKVKPTGPERIVFGDGDGSDLAVFDTELGRVGALQCWEHAQPLFKQVMMSQHEEIHCASWPCFPPGLPHFSLGAEANYASNMTYAIETGSFVIVATAPLTEQNLDVIAHDMPAARANLGMGGGLAQIFDPEGRAIGVRPAHDAQALCIAEIDPARCLIAKSALDPVGHYGRPDIFQLSFDNRPRQHVLAGHHGSTRVRSGVLRKSRMDIFPPQSSDSTSD